MAWRSRRLALGGGVLAGDLVHPWPLLSIAVLAANDHLLKGSGILPAWLTGKLSDFAGLFFFPVLLTLIVERLLRGQGSPSRRTTATISAWLTAVAFALLKTVPALASAVGSWVGAIVADPTDLLALPMVALSYRYLVRAAPRRKTPLWAERAAMVAASISALATSQAPSRHGYALWQSEAPVTWTSGCAKASAWVSKSGKTGLGLTVHLESEAGPCVARIASATLQLPNRSPLPAAVLLPVEVTVGTPESPRVDVYLPFAFDNDRAWNEHVTTGTVTLTLSERGQPEIVKSLSVEQRYEGYHVYLPPRVQPRVLPKPKPAATMYEATSPDASLGPSDASAPAGDP